MPSRLYSLVPAAQFNGPVGITLQVYKGGISFQPGQGKIDLVQGEEGIAADVEIDGLGLRLMVEIDGDITQIEGILGDDRLDVTLALLARGAQALGAHHGQVVFVEAEDEAVVVTAPRPEHLHAAGGIDPVDHSVGVIIGLEEDLQPITALVDLLLVAIEPEIHAQTLAGIVVLARLINLPLALILLSARILLSGPTCFRLDHAPLVQFLGRSHRRWHEYRHGQHDQGKHRPRGPAGSSAALVSALIVRHGVLLLAHRCTFGSALMAAGRSSQFDGLVFPLAGDALLRRSQLWTLVDQLVGPQDLHRSIQTIWIFRVANQFDSQLGVVEIVLTIGNLDDIDVALDEFEHAGR